MLFQHPTLNTHTHTHVNRDFALSRIALASSDVQASTDGFYTAADSPAASSHRLFVPFLSGGARSQTGTAAALLPAGAILRPVLQMKTLLHTSEHFQFRCPKRAGRVENLPNKTTSHVGICFYARKVVDVQLRRRTIKTSTDIR